MQRDCNNTKRTKQNTKLHVGFENGDPFHIFQAYPKQNAKPLL